MSMCSSASEAPLSARTRDGLREGGREDEILLCREIVRRPRAAMAVLLRLRNLVPLLCMPLQHARPHAALPLQRRSVHLHPLVPALSSSPRALDDDNIAAAAANRPRLLAPVRHLLSNAVHRGYAKYNSQGLARATSNPKFVAAPDAAIVLHYSSIIRSIVNYYSFVHSRSSLWKVTSIYRKSCALTLARKHSLRSAQAAYSKFGPKLRISTPDSKVDAIILFYPDSLKTTGKFNIHSPRYSQVAILQEPFEKKRWR